MKYTLCTIESVDWTVHVKSYKQFEVFYKFITNYFGEKNKIQVTYKDYENYLDGHKL